MTIVYAYSWVPEFAQGLLRDLRVRWALEEVGRPYQDRLITLEEKDGPDYRAVQPFGQIPAMAEDGLVLFESGAIVLHIAQGSEFLMPADTAGRAQVTTWLFAAVSTVEPQAQQLVDIDLFNSKADWAKARRPMVVKALEGRLACVAERLAGRDYLADRFSAADLMMTMVFRSLRHTDLVDSLPILAAYRDRCLDRPAFARALDRQMAIFASHAPAD